MRFERRSPFFLMGLGLALAMGFAGTSGTLAGCAECRCGLPGIAVDVPTERAADVAHVTVSGPACDSVVPYCADPSAASCVSYRIEARVGACHIAVTFLSGASPVETDVEFQQFDGCCAGVYPANGSRRFEVPSLTNGDAGASGG